MPESNPLRRLAPLLPPVFLHATILLCCGLPLAWMAYQLVVHPDIWREAIPDAFRWKLIARTFGYSILASLLAAAIGALVAVALGSGRLSRALWCVLPIPLLMPSIVITYGWSMFLERVGLDPMPQSAGDVARCVVAIASWLWPIAAMMLAYALRRIDPGLILQARLEGATFRIVARLLLPTLLLAWLITLLLSLQEFAVFERTGISVIATEVRSIFETGASLDRNWSMELIDEDAPAPQSQRMAAALAVMLPALGAMLILVAAIALLWRRWSAQSEIVDDNSHALRRPMWVVMIGWLLSTVVIAIPIVTMAATVHRRFSIMRIVNEYAPQLRGSILLASLTAIVAGVCAVVVAIRGHSRLSIVLPVAAFLIGGQWVAISLIIIFNRPWLLEVYDSYALPIIAYLCRFLWIALVGALMTWSPSMRGLRELAHTDGADRFATWRFVVLPITWPLTLGATILVFTLALTEVPATTLLQPAQTLVPMLMTWAHKLNYPSMVEASLLLVLIVMAAGVLVTVLVRRGVRT